MWLLVLIARRLGDGGDEVTPEKERVKQSKTHVPNSSLITMLEIYALRFGMEGV
jgi:hypothetical protein